MSTTFLGAPYPIQRTPLGLLAHSSDVAQIKSDILILLLTNPGERVFLPTFGTPLRNLLFDPNDSTLAAQAIQMINNSLTTWEPRVTITAINVNVNTDSAVNSAQDPTDTPHILFIQILFLDPGDITNVEELVLEIPLTGGGAQ